VKPIEETKTVTVYKCADCGKEYENPHGAEQCCACCTCGGPTSAEDKKIARGGSSSYYRSDLLCEWCRIRKDVKALQDRVRHAESHVEQARTRFVALGNELKKRQEELAALTAKRDALPPKPRAPKEKKESAA
jgi:hypothetical protein